MSTVYSILIKVCLCSLVLFQACSRKEYIDIPIPPLKVVISDIQGIPEGTEIAYVKASIQGAGSKVIGEVSAEFTDGCAVVTLPGDIPADKLCKVGKDAFNDIVGHWPAEGISDRNAKVAWVDGFSLYNSEDVRVGYLTLTDWDRTGAASGKYFIYYHYADRPFTLSGYNLSHSGIPSYFYSAASFSAGWNAYAIVNAQESEGLPPPRLCTTVIPQGLRLFWRFSSGIG